MSHLITRPCKLTDRHAVIMACERLKLAEPVDGRAEFFDGQAKSGLLVKLTGWEYPIVIDCATGELHADNYKQAWGQDSELHKFLHQCAIETVKLENRAKGLPIIEQALAYGWTKLTITVEE